MKEQLGEYLVYLIILTYLIFLLASSRFIIFIIFVVVSIFGKVILVPSHLSISIVLAFAFVISFLILLFQNKRTTESFSSESAESGDRSENDTVKSDDKEDDRNDDDDNDDDDEVGNIDISKTFLEAYQNLNPEQIGSMTSETKKLIDTQKQLMTTLKSLTPIVKQGKELMDGFKGHFGNDKEFAKTLKEYLPYIAKKK